MFVSCGSYGDLHILSKGGKKIHETLDGEGAGAVSHQGRDVGLLEAENLPSLGLGEAALLDDPLNLQRESRLQKLLFRMGKAEVGEHIPAALFALILFFVFVAMLVLPFSVETFGLSQTAADEVHVPLGRGRYPSSISSGRRAERRPPPRSGPCKPLATCRPHGPR